MARTLAALPTGTRMTDYISLGVLAKTFPISTVQETLTRTGKRSQRQRDLPAHVVIYYVIALALYMQVSCREVLRCLLEGLVWLLGPGAAVRIAGRSGISQARSRLGWEPLQQLHDALVGPIATPTTTGAWYRGLRVISLDGSTMDVADTGTNAATFGRPASARGRRASPTLRFVALLETGTHVLFGTRMAGYGVSELVLARAVVETLGPGMLCLADRAFFGFDLWTQATARKAELLWRVKTTLRLPCLTRLPDGSSRSRIMPSRTHRAQHRPLTCQRASSPRWRACPTRSRALDW